MPVRDENLLPAGDYAAEIHPSDEACIRTLRDTFGVPESMPDAEEFHVYGECPEGGNPQMTVVQIDADAQISWKTLTMFELGTLNSVLRCVLAPILIGLAIRSAVILVRKPDPSRQIRRL